MKYKLWVAWNKPSQTDALTTLYSANDIEKRLSSLPKSIADIASNGKSGEVVNVTIRVIVPDQG